MSAWKILSFITGTLIFFSGIAPVTVHAKALPLTVITARVQASINHPRFACQILWVRIEDQDREEFEILVSSLSHIDIVGRRTSQDVEKDNKYIVFKIQSLMWVPGASDFRSDYKALRELSSLEIVGCQMFTQSSSPTKK